MTTIYRIADDTLFWTGEVDQLGDDQDTPQGWVAIAPPELGSGEQALWTGDGWSVFTAPPLPPPVTICRIDLETGLFASETAAIDADGACPKGWVRASPPAQPAEGSCFLWAGDAGWIEVETSPVDLDQIRSRALDVIGQRRWEATLFFQYDGARAWADSALGAVIGIVVGSQILPPDGPQNFKLGPGVFRLWTVAQITAYGIAIRTHIQACFDREAELTTAVLAANTEEAVAMVVADAQAGWPQ